MRFGFFVLLFSVFFGLSLEAGGIALNDTVWSYSAGQFSPQAYKSGVESLLAAFEKEREEPIRPGNTGTVALKISTQMGPGLSTPKPLVQALVHSLEKRGFQKDKIFIFDIEAHNLRAAGYLPPLSSKSPNAFDGVAVRFLTPQDLNSKWFYESSLPAVLPEPHPRTHVFKDEKEKELWDRRSFLPMPLISEVDYWINLPVFTANNALGVSGALVNASLWNVNNYERFIKSELNGAVAAAEITAIPELRQKCLFTLASLEHFQYLNGPPFNSGYVEEGTTLWLTTNPVALDYQVFGMINDSRKDRKLSELSSPPRLMGYAKSLGLGEFEPGAIHWVRLKRAEM